MLDLLKHPLAEQDLEETWFYSHSKWGAARADAYLLGIDKRMQALCAFPDMGSVVSGFGSHVRKLRSEHHLIYYRRDGDALVIVRVLQEKMEPTDRIIEALQS